MKFNALLVAGAGLLTTVLVAGATSAWGARDLAEPSAPKRIPITADVERIYFSGSGTLTIRQGARTEVQVEAPAAVAAALVVEVFDGALYIEAPADPAGLAGIGAQEIHIQVLVDHLREVVSDGVNRVVVEQLQADQLSLDATGAGSMLIQELQADELYVTGSDGAIFNISGQVDRQVLDLADHGRYQARALLSRSVEAKVVGGGSVLLQVDELLDVRLAGSADLRYVGSPFVAQRVSGPGSVAPVTEISI